MIDIFGDQRESWKFIRSSSSGKTWTGRLSYFIIYIFRQYTSTTCVVSWNICNSPGHICSLYPGLLLLGYLNETIDLCIGVTIVCQFYTIIQLLYFCHILAFYETMDVLNVFLHSRAVWFVFCNPILELKKLELKN